MKDFPDPLDEPIAPQGASPDDLLSQMADEAIDKLMADAEKGIERGALPPDPTDSLDPPAAAPDAASDKDADEIDAALAADESLVGEAPGEAAAVEGAANLQTELDAILNQMDDAPSEAAPNAADAAANDSASDALPAAIPVDAGAPPVEQPAEHPADKGADADTHGLEILPDHPAHEPASAHTNELLHEPEHEPAHSPVHSPSHEPAPPAVHAGPPLASASDSHAHAAIASAAAIGETGGRGADVTALLDEAVATSPSRGESVAGSILLMPLRLLNAPFNGLPEAQRDALGQIGIVTLLNAVAVLVYVLWFRRG